MFSDVISTLKYGLRILPALILLLFLCVALPADASERGQWSLVINGLSRHIGTEREYNERNTGAGLLYQQGRLFMTAGAYKNSHSETSGYLLVGRRWGRYRGPWLAEVGLMGGMVSGYGSGPIGALLPMVSLGHERARINVVLIPGMGSVDATTLAAQLELRF